MKATKLNNKTVSNKDFRNNNLKAKIAKVREGLKGYNFKNSRVCRGYALWLIENK